MKTNEINIRDPFILTYEGKYYMYGTRGANTWDCTDKSKLGFDVYVSDDLENWSAPQPIFECFDGFWGDRQYWAPEVHKYNGKYYMFATFTQENGLRGTYALVSDSLTGPFLPHSKGPLTPTDWECLDGTLYVDESGVPYLIFCHEHTQIIDGTVCYVRLNESLDAAEGEVVTLFCASSCEWADYVGPLHYVTDGPFMYRSESGELFMIWSSFIKEDYAEFVVRFKNGRLGPDFEHLPPLLDSDGGHGMIFSDGRNAYFTYHTPNTKGFERPEFCLFEDNGSTIAIIKK